MSDSRARRDAALNIVAASLPLAQKINDALFKEGTEFRRVTDKMMVPAYLFCAAALAGKEGLSKGDFIYMAEVAADIAHATPKGMGEEEHGNQNTEE